jgi:hypothetical protein
MIYRDNNGRTISGKDQIEHCNERAYQMAKNSRIEGVNLVNHFKILNNRGLKDGLNLSSEVN